MRRAALLTLLLLAACDQMKTQPRYDADGRAALFADGKANQLPPPGSVAQEDAAWIAAEATRPPMTLALLQRGRERYAIACEPCHDPAGYGEGVIPSRGYPRPESFHTQRLRAMTSRHVVDVITHGYGVMYPHADRVAPADRWAIAAYVQALQLSQGALAQASPAPGQARPEAVHVQ